MLFNFSGELIRRLCGSTNGTAADLSFAITDMLQESQWRIFLISLYTIVIVFGFLENLLVFLVIVSNKQLRTVTNIFISTLAVSDIVICVCSLPFQLHYGITNHWHFGNVLCRIINPLFAVPIFVSTFTILAIAVERFVLIVFPFKQKMTSRTATTVVIIIVITSVCLSLPVIMYTNFDELNIVVPDMNVDIHKTYCTEVWPSVIANRSYTMFVFIVQFIIPYIVICVLYFKIYHSLKMRPLKRKDRRRNYRTTMILLAITVFFTISWLPFQIFSVILYFYRLKIVQSLGPAYQFTDLILKIVAMSSACINPFFYGWLNDNFRKELGKLVGRNMKKLRLRNTGYTYTVTNHNEHEIRSITRVNGSN
ncbi:hypothetical protein FSP39_021468 [Pinctada imbricata]|uniref:G-protein coupled receptors family 1 profile domain-containing protein n=1 Tax=Pinctada imbricata TaxID=66713 RepID=A0AA88XWQ5_PINIB|nr:hypothetical protein FSP39_021468 [Pinctada imbricata]